MSTCKIDHSRIDVLVKLSNQKPYLPEELYNRVYSYPEENIPQSKLNEIFHLLKKFDLISNQEQNERIQRFDEVLSN